MANGISSIQLSDSVRTNQPSMATISAANVDTTVPVLETPPFTPGSTLSKVVIMYTLRSLIPTSLAIVSAPATVIVEMNMTAKAVWSSRPRHSRATAMHGGRPTPRTFFQVRSPSSPSCRPCAFFRSKSRMVATKPAMVKTARRKKALMEAKTPTNAPTRNDATAPPLVRQWSMYASTDRAADSTMAMTTRKVISILPVMCQQN